MEFDLENPLEYFHDLPNSQDVSSLFLIESDHIPPLNYFQNLKSNEFDASVRTDFISLISQLSCNFDPFVTYLAINYLDRFLANQGILQPKPWANKLLAVTCFSLAVKMLKTEYSATDVQALMNHGDGGFIFETQTIKRMEALVLGALQWRMRSITPFSFIPYFTNLFMLDDITLKVLKDRASEIILKSQKDVKVMEFKPSIVAASSLLYSSHELFPFQYPCFLGIISNCSYESVMECYNVIQDIAKEEYESMFNVHSSSGTPVNVLDENFLSLESEKTNGTNVAHTTMIQEKHFKRRKI
ncbi:putative cyclin-D6-1 isoform X2 [Medicago truncatula]|uniref:B-like cyclin n=1 Tax=Medicago truncatula TaxID=3880 RepID=A0A072VAG5_MEDTR|nr:putative cyclin-D6-1 isoform X2 [Medicago truncatula]KEH39029.1 carboxy-terminal domain cyclin [Medicago truncatula]